MIPSDKYLIDSMRQIRLDKLAYFFYPEQRKAIVAQSKQEGITIDINEINNGWNGCIYKKKERLDE